MTLMTKHYDAEYVHLYALGLIPRYVVLASLCWVLHDYFVTLEDEIRYIWKQKSSFSKFMFFWIRYYTISVVLFDALQIHLFAIPGIVNRTLCVATDPLTRMVGAISLWSVEIIMMLRIYVLYRRSKQVAILNGGIFVFSIIVFVWIMVKNALHRSAVLAKVVDSALLRGCPVINGGSQWAQWLPATVLELVLFGFVLGKAAASTTALAKLNGRPSLTSILLQENILYFFAVAFLLIFNNLMVVGATRIPWFGFGPFHAALGITTSRMLIHLRKFSSNNLEGSPNSALLVDIRAVDNQRELCRASISESEVGSYDSESPINIAQDLESMAGTSQNIH